MTDKRRVDVLIVGQGLAGSLLALELLERGLQVCVVDDGHRSSATRMAAGLLNPVTGLRVTRIRQADIFLPLARQRYADLERALGQRFFYLKPMLRLFRDERQRRDWSNRLQDSGYHDYLEEPLLEEEIPPMLDAPYGAALQRHTGYLDTRVFLDAARQWLAQRDAIREAAFDWTEVTLEGQWACWRDLEARRMISCEGYVGMRHPHFPWLPLRPCKGQILTLATDRNLPDWILNRGHWLLPIGQGRVRCGATYEREDIESGPTPEALDELQRVAQSLFRDDMHWRLLEAEAGVRPGTRDRMPLAGLHPREPRFGVLNGFGSKGVLMAPYYARCMADHLEQGVPLPEDVSLMRWWNPHGQDHTD